MCNKATLQVKDQALKEKNLISVKSFLTEFKRASDSSSIQKGTAL